MAEAVTKSDDNEPQREGSRIANVNQLGAVQSIDGKEAEGIATINERWAGRSMGNDGPVT